MDEAHKELVKRLRRAVSRSDWDDTPVNVNPDGDDAADALEAAEAEVVRLRELVFNVAKAAIPEWKKEFQRAAQFEAKLAIIEANNGKGKS